MYIIIAKGGEITIYRDYIYIGRCNMWNATVHSLALTSSHFSTVSTSLLVAVGFYRHAV